MEYSKMTTVEVFNFMAYKHAKIMFDEQGIINLKGYNSSGKSAMNKAIAVCLMNLYVRSQSKFIKHGEEYFRVIVSFDDGVSIVRDKYINGQSLYEMYKDGQCVYTSKQGNKLTKVDDVPAIIKDYLGLIELEAGYLNFQTRDDPLWLVETKGSENYVSLNEVLKTEEIARANTLLNSDKNKLNSEIAEIESDLQQSELLLQNYSSIKEELLVALSEKEVKVQDLVSRCEDIKSIASTVESLSKIRLIPEVDNIDIRKMKSVLDIQKIILDIGNIKKYPEIDTITTDKLIQVNQLVKTLEELKGINTKLLPIELDDIDISKYAPLGRLSKELKALANINGIIEELEAQEKNLQEEKDKLIEDANKQGIKFVVCDNCGTLLEVSN